MQFLKANTAIDVLIGPFVDSTDGATLETGLTISQADVLLSKNGQTLTQKNDVTAAAADSTTGYYNCELDATDTNTEGCLVLTVSETGALPVRHEYMVLAEAAYDSFFAPKDTGFMDVNVEAVQDTTQTAGDIPALITTVDTVVDSILVDTGTTLDTKLNDIQGATFSSATDSLEALRDRGDAAWTGSAITSDSGTAQAGAAGSITLQAGASASDSIYNGQVIYISSGTGAGQSRAIDGYTGSSKVATVISNWAVTPDATSVYEIYPDDITEVTAAPTADAVADAVWDENTAGHTTAGTFGEQCKNDIDAILTDTSTTLQTAIDTIDTNVDAVLLDTAEIGTAGAGLTNINLPDQTMNITGNLSGSVGSVTGAVGSVTGAVGSVTGAVGSVAGNVDGNVTGSVGSLVGHTVQTGDTYALANGLTGFTAIDTVVDAIKVKTDSLTFTVAGEVDANVESINATTVVGAGITANKWRA